MLSLLAIVLLLRLVQAVPVPDAQAIWVAGLGVAAAFIAQAISGQVVGIWNKAGGWLDAKSNGAKRVVAIVLTGALGLLANVIFAAVTHTTNWILTFLLSVAAGVVNTITAGVSIETVKSKLLGPVKAGTGPYTNPPPGYRP